MTIDWRSSRSTNQRYRVCTIEQLVTAVVVDKKQQFKKKGEMANVIHDITQSPENYEENNKSLRSLIGTL